MSRHFARHLQNSEPLPKLCQTPAEQRTPAYTSAVLSSFLHVKFMTYFLFQIAGDKRLQCAGCGMW